MTSKKKKQRHLSLTDRTFIEQELVRGSSFTDIGKALGKDPSTIAKEIKLHMETRKASGSAHGCSNFRNYKECTLQHMCGSITCKRKCKSCNLFQHHHNCPDDNQYTCDAPFKPPYVCNGCDERNHCHLEKHYYHAAKAQAAYEATLTTSRQGINMTPEELAELDAIISPLIKKGQPLSHIFSDLQR